MALPDIYLDAAATTPPLPEVLRCVEHLQREAWANPSSLHGPGLLAAEALTRFRLQIAACFGAEPEQLIFTSGATESVHLALLGAVMQQPPGRLVISALEHPAVEAAAHQLIQRGWKSSPCKTEQWLHRLGQWGHAIDPNWSAEELRLVGLLWLCPMQDNVLAVAERLQLTH